MGGMELTNYKLVQSLDYVSLVLCPRNCECIFGEQVRNACRKVMRKFWHDMEVSSSCDRRPYEAQSWYP